MKRLAEEHGSDELVVVFGLNEPANLRIMASTFKNGDPSYAGALGGVALGLPSYHILELADEVPEEVWREQMAMKELEIPQVPAWADANRPRVTWFLELLDRELAKREFVAGDRYTVADITTQVALDFMKPARLLVPEGATNIKRWHSAVSTRPSAKA